MKDIVYTLEFDDFGANAKANDCLSKGWTLLHVGTKIGEGDNDNGQAEYYTAYVVGANQEQYDKYQKENKDFDINDLKR